MQPSRQMGRQADLHRDDRHRDREGDGAVDQRSEPTRAPAREATYA